jgi:hypothetical protein
MAGPSRDKHVLPGKIPRLLDEPLTDTTSQSSVSYLDFAQEDVQIQEASDNEDLCKVHLNTALVLNYRAFNYHLEGLKWGKHLLTLQA